MATSPNIYALTEFQLAILAETTVGTANTSSMQLVNIDSLFAPSDNVYLNHDVRHGDGRTLKAADTFATEKGQVKSISFSGLLDETVARILIPNCIGVVGTGEGTEQTYAIPYNFTGTNVADGDSPADASIGTLTVALINPTTNKARIYPGCVISELTITGDQATDGGRLHFSATAQTKYLPTNSTTDPSTLAYATTIPTIREFETKTVASLDVVMNKFELSLNSHPGFFGNSGDCEPEVIGRGIPSIEANLTLGLKYDANTLDLYQDYAAGDSIAVNLADSTGEAMVIAASYGKITGDVNPADFEGAAFIDLPLKLTAHTSGSVVSITI